jgi:hypothetical protein
MDFCCFGDDANRAYNLINVRDFDGMLIVKLMELALKLWLIVTRHPVLLFSADGICLF